MRRPGPKAGARTARAASSVRPGAVLALSRQMPADLLFELRPAPALSFGDHELALGVAPHGDVPLEQTDDDVLTGSPGLQEEIRLVPHAVDRRPRHGHHERHGGLDLATRRHELQRVAAL